MEGIIIALQSRQAEIYSAGRVLQADLPAAAAHARAGDRVELAESADGSLKVSAVKPLPLPDNVAWSEDNTVPGHHSVELDTSLRLCAEGPDFASCYRLLAQKAGEYRANALLQLQTSYVRRLLHRELLCRVSAVPAQITGEHFSPAPGLKMQLPLKYIRRNSPNGAWLRYCRVLLICLLLIAEPCLAALTHRSLLPQIAGQTAMAALPLLCLAAAFYLNPRRLTCFLTRVRR